VLIFNHKSDLTIFHESNPSRLPNSGYIFVSLVFFSLQCVFYSIHEKFKGSFTKIYPIRGTLEGEYRNKMYISESSQEIFSVFWWISVQHIIMRGTRRQSSLRHCATSRKVAGSIRDRVNGRSLLTQYFRLHYGPEVDSASNRNEYQEYFLRGKGGRCIRLTTLLPPCTDCLEIWEPQHPGFFKACTGIALTLPLTLPFTQTI